MMCLPLLCAILCGCRNTDQNMTACSSQNKAAVTAIPAIEANTTEILTVTGTSEPDPLTLRQRNAINIPDYLCAPAQEIRSSSNSRLYPELCFLHHMAFADILFLESLV